MRNEWRTARGQLVSFFALLSLKDAIKIKSERGIFVCGKVRQKVRIFAGRCRWMPFKGRAMSSSQPPAFQFHILNRHLNTKSLNSNAIRANFGDSSSQFSFFWDREEIHEKWTWRIWMKFFVFGFNIDLETSSFLSDLINSSFGSYQKMI